MTSPGSSQPWVRASRGSLCPICGKPDWCSVSGDGGVVICMRVAEGSVKTTPNGGYLHRLSPLPQRSYCRDFIVHNNRPGRDDLPHLADYYSQQALRDPHHIEALAAQLDLPVWTLLKLGAGWSPRRGTYSFPMKSADGTTIGIRLRRKDGGKLAVRGSREGLFLPDNLDQSDRVLISEGPTDCAALLSLGFQTIGRPSCVGGVAHVVDYVTRHVFGEAVVVSDGDEQGQRGAFGLAKTLCLYIREVRVITPPAGIKDARAWLNSGITAEVISNSIEHAEPLRLRYTTR
jgi:hypothetical protein